MLYSTAGPRRDPNVESSYCDSCELRLHCTDAVSRASDRPKHKHKDSKDRVCMGVHGCAWVCMGVHGCAWVCMGVHGCAWVCMGVHGCAWVCMCRSPLYACTIPNLNGLQDGYWHKTQHLHPSIVPLGLSRRRVPNMDSSGINACLFFGGVANLLMEMEDALQTDSEN